MARGARRRHRQLLGKSALHRREGRPERADLGRHPLRARHGFAHPRHQPGKPAARLGGGLHAGEPPGDRGVRGAAPAHRRRPQPQGAQPASRRAGAGRLHARGRGGRGLGAHQPARPQRAAPHPRPRPLDPHPDGPDRDRRALYHLHRPCEPRAARAPQAGGPGGEDLQPLRRSRAADRPRPSRRRAHGRVLPLLAQPRALLSNGRTRPASSRT